MKCDKIGCDNIMCNTCVNSNYYICEDCRVEFKKWLSEQTPLYLDSNTFLYTKFTEFMAIEKENSKVTEEFDDIVDEFLNSY